MRRFIKTFHVEGLGLVATMDERTGKKLFGRLSQKSTQFSFFSREEAVVLVNLFKNPSEEEIDLLIPPFSGDWCGGIGDCIVCAENCRIFTIDVSVRGRIRFDANSVGVNGLSCWGGGKVFIKINKFIEWESCSLARGEYYSEDVDYGDMDLEQLDLENVFN